MHGAPGFGQGWFVSWRERVVVLAIGLAAWLAIWIIVGSRHKLPGSNHVLNMPSIANFSISFVCPQFANKFLVMFYQGTAALLLLVSKPTVRNHNRIGCRH